MNLSKIISMLEARKAQIDVQIVALEKLCIGESPVRSRRGRRFMGEEERRQVSARMKAYWAQRQE